MFQQSKRTLAVAVAAAGLALPISGVALAAAQTVDPPASSTSTTMSGTPPSGQDATNEERAARRTEWVNDVAAKLGVSNQQLQSAIDSVRLDHLTARLDQRVAAGKMTQAEADDTIAKATAGDWPARGVGRRHHR